MILYTSIKINASHCIWLLAILNSVASAIQRHITTPTAKGGQSLQDVSKNKENKKKIESTISTPQQLATIKTLRVSVIFAVSMLEWCKISIGGAVEVDGAAYGVEN